MLALFFVDITPLRTTLCGDYPCEHYLYIQWLIMTSQWLMTLLDTSIVISQWEMTLLGIHIMIAQCILMLLCEPFYDVLICPIIILLLSKYTFWNCTLNIKISMKSIVWHKTRTSLSWSSLEIMFIVFGRNISSPDPADQWYIPIHNKSQNLHSVTTYSIIRIIISQMCFLFNRKANLW